MQFFIIFYYRFLLFFPCLGGRMYTLRIGRLVIDVPELGKIRYFFTISVDNTNKINIYVSSIQYFVRPCTTPLSTNSRCANNYCALLPWKSPSIFLGCNAYFVR